MSDDLYRTGRPGAADWGGETQASEAAQRAAREHLGLAENEPDESTSETTRESFREFCVIYDRGVAHAVSQMRRLADARADYSGEEIEFQVATVRNVADIIEGTNDGAGWLPSWRWAEFGVEI